MKPDKCTKNIDVANLNLFIFYPFIT